MAEPRRPLRPLPALALLLPLALSALAAATSCLSRRDDETARVNQCTTCHGDGHRAGSPLVQAAPPRDLLGASDVSYPGVGAHLIHLEAGPTHGAVACQECHTVPERVDSPGHADDAAPAEIHFGSLARGQAGEASYDFVARRCDNTYCHGGARAVWTEPRSSESACGSCHGLPPPAPHPQSERCFTCHGDVIDPLGHFRAPELHVDGQVQLQAESCTQCHGQDENPAPPLDTLGNSSPRALGVGAHAAHLSGGKSGRPLECSECHEVPERLDAFEHADGLPAEVRLIGVAAAHDSAPLWDHSRATCVDSWCHGLGSPGRESPQWNRPAALGCGSCHGAPPPAPHPQMSQCSKCHADVVAADDVTIADRSRHVDGVVDVELDPSCTSCHGSDNPAPPRDLAGHSATTFSGVGAHQTHVLGTARSRAVPCAECHQVPAEVLSPGHVDTPLPAEVVFSGAAVAFGGGASYAAGSCSQTSCHGAVFPGQVDSGGSLTEPSWTKVDGTQAACGSCHGLPPPRPHPYYASDCGRCHQNMTPDGKSFVRPELHVDGVVTFTLP